MKKTIHINLSGMAFTIEEDAYEKLNTYLIAVESKLGNSDEARETIDDIESRMAELFAPVAHGSGVAIKLEDVEEVIKVLGKPEDYVAGDEEEPKSSPKPPPVYIPKRLYRDPHSRVFGGVCSGLGAYFNVDPIIFRLLFVLGLFYGISILPYIILWIAIPKALTMEQRMQMYGGDIGLNKAKATASAVRSDESSPLDKLLRVAGVVVGVIMIVVTFLAMVALTLAVLFSTTAIALIPDGAWMSELPGLILGPSISLTATTGIILFIGIPLLMFFFLGLQLVFQFRNVGKVIGIIGLILWLSGIALLVYSGLQVATQFTHQESISQTEMLEPFNGDTLYIQQLEMTEFYKGRRILRTNGLQVWNKNGNVIVEGRPYIEVKNNAARFAITVEKTSQGSDARNALGNASDTEYIWLQKDSVLQLDRIFTLGSESALREQKVRVIVEVPVGKNVVTDRYISTLIK